MSDFERGNELYFRERRFEDALACYRSVPEGDPSYATACHYIGHKDTDFYQRSLVYGASPKVIWLRIGNVPTAAVAALFRHRHAVIRLFYDDPNATFLPLNASSSWASHV